MRVLAISAIILSLGTAGHAATLSADTATATSVFSGGFVAENTINGSGMSAGFGPGDTHATYVSGNHWTTRANETLGQSITWGFNTGKTLGGIHIWNHLSNGIAANAFYAPTRFDLELFDTANTSLGSITSVAMNHSTDTSQSFDLGQVFTDVGSITFTVRETRAEQDGFTGTRFTGLAEVLFEDERLETTVIPLPAAGWVLLSGLGLLGLVARRRRT